MRSLSAAVKRRRGARWVTWGSGRRVAADDSGTAGLRPLLRAVFMCVSKMGRSTLVFLLRPEDLHKSPYGDLSHPIVAHRVATLTKHSERSYLRTAQQSTPID